jgi:hypothetical protein
MAKNETLIRHLAAEAVHDPQAAAATYHEECWYENAALALRFEGRDMVAQYEWELDLGDVVVQCGRLSGVVGTEVFGVPATGGPLDLPFTAVISFRDGLMAGEHVWFDLGSFCDQVGADLDSVRTATAELAGSLQAATGA